MKRIMALDPSNWPHKRDKVSLDRDRRIHTHMMESSRKPIVQGRFFKEKCHRESYWNPQCLSQSIISNRNEIVKEIWLTIAIRVELWLHFKVGGTPHFFSLFFASIFFINLKARLNYFRQMMMSWSLNGLPKSLFIRSHTQTYKREWARLFGRGFNYFLNERPCRILNSLDTFFIQRHCQQLQQQQQPRLPASLSLAMQHDK